MNIDVTKNYIAASCYIKEQIKIVLESIGYDVDRYYRVLQNEPVQVDDVIKGLIFRRTYHRWYWKQVATIRITEESYGKFVMDIDIPYSEKWLDVNEFIDGIKKRLSDVYLDDCLRINLKAVARYELIQTNNIPSYY